MSKRICSQLRFAQGEQGQDNIKLIGREKASYGDEDQGKEKENQIKVPFQATALEMTKKRKKIPLQYNICLNYYLLVRLRLH